MLKIRREQTQAVSYARDTPFVAEAKAYLRTEFPSQAAERGDEALGQTIRSALARAHACGITRRADITTLASLMLVLGDAFEGDPKYAWASPILDSRTLQAETKVPLVVERLAQNDDERS